MRRANGLVGKAPATKRSLERFIFEMKAFFHELGQQDVFWVGNLKHRDLSGNCVGSQVRNCQRSPKGSFRGEGTGPGGWVQVIEAKKRRGWMGPVKASSHYHRHRQWGASTQGRDVSRSALFQVGNLKHRDLSDNCVQSHMQQQG